ncbi:MAG: glycoside hydrolase family 2 protein [Cytophagales bacterium]|nr:glycoside hydrolase family 2 protein [Armatimonadota bacterium]
MPRSQAPMNIISFPLDSFWEVAERLPAANPVSPLPGGERGWIPAMVPGHVHGDLMRAGVIGDPFYRMQERSARWVDETDWTYRTTFSMDDARLAARGPHGRHFLRFESLDTLARVFLNDQLVGAVENGFVPHRFDVTEILRAGENRLRVEFDSALRIGQERAAAYLGDGSSTRGSQSYFNFAPRAFIRKPQYMFGWDWGPELVSCGIAGPVELITVPVAEITDVRIDYTFTDPITVDIRITVTTEKYAPMPVVLSSALYAPGDNTPSATLPDAPGRHTVELRIGGQKVALWNPNGMELAPSVNGLRPKGGPQKRYLLNLKLVAGDDLDENEQPLLLHLRGETIGFRTVELRQEEDADGKGAEFKFRINGVDTFIKGANWIPDHSFPSQITRQTLRQRLTKARDAGFNMLRVWGGGLYESDDFYQICSELGLLVWQDFAFACSMYPEDLPDFVEGFRSEATLAVRRLRNYPCLALWCGGNENLELFQDRWAGATQATEFYGDRLIHETIPAILEVEDGRTPYLPNSPYGGKSCTSEDFGDSHYWNVWHSKKPGSDGDWPGYAESTTRFSSEFGFASPCGWAAWESATLPEDRVPRSRVAQWHDKTRKGYEKYLSYIEKHYPRIETFDDLIYYGQANQADALRFGIEHWRRIKGRCWGTLFWQINDCWPAQSWAVIDSAGEPKAAYYAAKRFYASLLVSLVRAGDAVEAHLVSDLLKDTPGTLTLRLLDFAGGETARQVAIAVNAPANAASGAVVSLKAGEEMGLVHATFAGADGVTLAENLLLLGEPKDLTLPDPGLRAEVTENAAGTAMLAVTTERFAGYVWLRFDDLGGVVPTFSDNWFHLLPGETRIVSVAGLPLDHSIEAVRERLVVRHLGGAARHEG